MMFSGQHRKHSNAGSALQTLESRRLLTSYFVTSTGDSGPATLRDAIEQANADTPSVDYIYLQIIGGTVASPRFIDLQSPLPPINDRTSLYVVKPYTLNAVGIRPAAGHEGQFDGLTVNSFFNLEGVQVRGFRNGVVVNADNGGSIGHVNEGNIIADNAGSGVLVHGSVAIQNNLIFNNGGPQIDLGGDGRTLNDPADADLGPNQFQNYPIRPKSHDTLEVTGSSPVSPT
jgi:hypothetical protein